jgi:hypothetical protein
LNGSLLSPAAGFDTALGCPDLFYTASPQVKKAKGGVDISPRASLSDVMRLRWPGTKKSNPTRRRHLQGKSGLRPDDMAERGCVR